MASQEPIEKMTVRLEVDIRDLLAETDKAMTKAERALDRLDKKGKQVGRFDALKRGFHQLGIAIAGFASQAAVAITAIGVATAGAVRMANQAVKDLRAERAFRNLAAGMGQSSEEILAAIDQASLGAIDRLSAISLANDALLLSVAKTPAEFEKLVRAASALGRAKGMDALQASLLLINAAGRRSTETLDNLGIGLSEVNQEMERLSQQQFGKPADQLSQVQRNALFSAAALEVASKKAEQLGGVVADLGTPMEQWRAGTAELKQELNELALIVTTLGTEGADTLAKGLWRGETFMQRAVRAAKDLQNILIAVISLLAGIGPAIGKLGANLQAFLRGEISFRELGSGVADSYIEGFQRRFGELQEQFKEILDPQAVVDAVVPPAAVEEAEEAADELLDITRGLAGELLDTRDQMHADLEALEQEHADRLRAINADLVKDLAKLDAETAGRRQEIFEEARRALEELARETDAALADEQADFNIEERRATEDHLREMRRLTQDYLFDLEDAVKERDARAVVDLQRRFALESQRREEDFDIQQGREREDFDRRLEEIRANEARRRQEILASQAQELQALMVHDAQRRAELEASAAEQRAMEMQNYAQRQAELQNALTERLRTIAKELADEEKVDAEGAQRILGTLARYFGAGGAIDQLMADFARRRAGRLVVEVGFEATGLINERLQSAEDRIRAALDRIPRFQAGGIVPGPIGRPQLAVVEAGERILPMSQSGGVGRHHFTVDFNIHGQLPTSMNQGDMENQMAGVILRALRDTGILEH